MKPKDTSLIATPMQHKTQQTNKQMRVRDEKRSKQTNASAMRASKHELAAPSTTLPRSERTANV
jgi:hypothetical protein